MKDKYIIISSLRHFRWNNIIQDSHTGAIWHVLLDNGDVSGFNSEQRQKFLDFCVNHLYNFGEKLNVTLFSEGGEPECQYRMTTQSTPSSIVLRSEPAIPKDGKIYHTMDIALVNQLGRDIPYDLSFNVISEILYK